MRNGMLYTFSPEILFFLPVHTFVRVTATILPLDSQHHHQRWYIRFSVDIDVFYWAGVGEAAADSPAPSTDSPHLNRRASLTHSLALS